MEILWLTLSRTNSSVTLCCNVSIVTIVTITVKYFFSKSVFSQKIPTISEWKEQNCLIYILMSLNSKDRTVKHFEMQFQAFASIFTLFTNRVILM